MFPGDPQPQSKEPIHGVDLSELFSRMGEGAEAKNALRTLAPVLGELKETLIKNLAFGPKDALTYSHIGGALWLLSLITGHLQMLEIEGEEASDELKRTKGDH